MRWIKFGVIILIVLFGAYAVSMLFVDERKDFVYQSEVDYPVDKVFPQFNNLQNFSHWNDFFSGDPNLSISFYTPYEGVGSAIRFQNRKTSSEFGEMFIKYSVPNKGIRYQLFDANQNYPYQIDVKFVSNGSKTKIIWTIHTPKQDLLKRSLNLLSEDFFVENIDKSSKNLFNMLGNKVVKDNLIASIKYDSIMIDQQEGALLLGVNVGTSNKKGALLKNVILHHNKVVNYVKLDLAKKDDEYGVPVLITNPSNFKDKEISYFYGVPLSKRISVSDNNFSFKTINASKAYVYYYKGNYDGRIKGIQQLLQKAKKDTMHSGDLHEEFLEEPEENREVKLKLTLPVYR
ncbi:polyketide cyclase [Chryseobacterium sp. T1]